jgi:Na+-transporting methylmalonyl-CoA/oxaloacetate decarboxylase gamma subunit
MNLQNMLAATEHLAGMLVVMFALAVLWGLASLSAWFVATFIKPEESGRSAPRAVPPPAPAKAAVAADDDEAVIVAAAVALVLLEHHRVVSVRPLPSAWGQLGRRDIHSSHHLR